MKQLVNDCAGGKSMKQLDNIILVTDTVEEIYEVFRTTFPELDGHVKGWSLWRCCDEQFRGIRVRLNNGMTVLYGLEKDEDEPDSLFWQVRPPILVPAPEKAE